MEPVAFSVLVLTFCFAGTACAIWMSKPRSIRHALAFFFGLAGALWSLSLYLIEQSTSPFEATFWTRTALAAPCLAFGAYVMLLAEVSRSPGERFPPWPTRFLVFLGLTIMIGAFHPEVILRTVSGNAVPEFVYGRYYPLHVLGLAVLALLSLFQAWRTRNAASGRERAQADIMLVGMMLSSAIAFVPNLLLPLLGNSDLYLWGPFPYCLALGATYYAIAKHRLYDIEIGLGWLFKTKRYLFHNRVREALNSADNYMSLAALSESLQNAFESKQLNLALLDTSGIPTQMFGTPDLPVPSFPLLSFPNGKVLTPSELPVELRREMADKGLSAIIRLGEVRHPMAIMTLGKPFEDVLFSSQDFRLLQFLARQMEIMIRIAERWRQDLEGRAQALASASSRATQERIFLGPETYDKRVLILDPAAHLVPLITKLPISKLHLESVATETEMAAQVSRESFDLAVLPCEPGRKLSALIRRLAEADPTLATIAVDMSEGDQAAHEEKALPHQFLGRYNIQMNAPENVARILDTAIAAARFFRGEFDLAAFEGSPQVKERLFPGLVALLLEGKDLTGMTRLFQKKMILHALRHSKTGTEAARKLGISAPNLSLKLNYHKIAERASG